MMPTLPLELQLHILELAVPPLTRKHLADHRELMRTWTLVCRDWCHEARRIVAVVPKLDYTKPEPEASRAAEAVLASATAGGRTLANLEVELDELSDDWPDDWLDTDRHGLPDVERIWVTAPNEGEIAVESFPRIRQLHLHDRLASDIVPSYALHHFPSSLTTMEVKAAYFEPWGPLPLRTLILDEAVYPMMIFKELSGLRFLAIRGALSDAIKNDLLHLLQRALEHLYFALSASPEGGMRAVAPNIAAHPFVLPPALKSLTFRYPSTFPVAVEVCGPLRAACEQQGVRFVEVVCTEADEEDWEAEEWCGRWAVLAQSSSSQLEMTPTLPLEIQLHILELAVPPLTRKHLADHRELMRTWTLVCRDWRKEVRRIVAAVPKLDYTTSDPEAVRAAEAVLASAMAGGRTISNLEVELDGLETGWPEGWIDMERCEFDKVVRIWASAPQDWFFSTEFFPHAQHLTLCDRHLIPLLESYEPPTFPASLISLEVKAIRLDICPTPLLRTLILDEVEWFPSIFDKLSSLHLIAYRGTFFDNDEHDLLDLLTHLPKSVEHVYLADAWYTSTDVPGWQAHFAAHAVTLPPSLKSLTFRHLSTRAFAAEVYGPLLAACEAQGVRFIEIVCTREDEEDWEAEEWAWALGG